MTEIARGILREVRQIKNAASTSKEIITSPNRPEWFQSTVIVGYSTLIPEKVKESGILNNPHRIQVVDAVKQYMITLNDRIDYKGANREDISELVKRNEQEEKTQKVEMDRAMSLLPENEQRWVRHNIEEAFREVNFVEDWIRRKRDLGELSFTDVEISRNIANAIQNVTLTTIIFDPDSLTKRLIPIKGNLDMQSIIDKYAWVMGRNPKDEIERALMVAHNVGTAVQIVDDWRGREIDELLRIPTFASAAIKIANGDELIAKAFLKRLEDWYKEKAQELGIGKTATEFTVNLADIAQLAHQMIAKSGRDHVWIRKKLENRSMGKREKDYMTRKI